MAAGVPVVADRVGQNSEYIEHGVSGLLVRPGDTEAFVAAVVRLLSAPDLAEQLGKGAQRRIRERFAWRTLTTLAEDAYLQ